MITKTFTPIYGAKVFVIMEIDLFKVRLHNDARSFVET